VSIIYEGTVENGQIKLSEDVRLPEHTKVLVLVPEHKSMGEFAIVNDSDGLPVIRASGIITSRLVREIESRTV